MCMPLQSRIKDVVESEESAREAYHMWVQDNDNETYSLTLVPTVMQSVGSGIHGPTIQDVHAALSDMRESGWRP